MVDPNTRILIIGFSALLIAVSFLIGLWGRRRMTNAQSYFGATGLFGPLTISLSSMAAVASAFALVGVPGLIYLSGNTIVLWMLGSPAFALGYMMLGKKVRAMAEIAPVATLGDVSDLRFNNHRGIKALVSIILLLGCVAYLASQIKAGADLFAHLMGWSPWTAALIIFGILAAYTVISGEVGGILTQAFQGLVMVVAGLIMIVAFFSMTGGPGAVVAAVSSADTITAGGVSKTFSPDLLNAWGTLPGGVALAWVLIPALGVICQPQVLTRMYALKDPRDLSRLSLYATLTHMVVASMVVCVGMGTLYLVSSGLVPPLESPDRAIFVFADYAGLHAQLFVYAAVLAAAMSTSSLFLSLSSGIISRDLPSALGIRMSMERQMKVSRITVAVLGFGAIWFAMSSGRLVAILGAFGFGTLMSATMPVFILGLLWKRASSQGVFAGLVVSLVFNIACLILDKLVGFRWPGGVPWYVLVVAASSVVTIAVSLVTKGATGDELDPRVEAVIDL